MPLFFLAVAIAAIVTGLRGTQGQLLSLLKSDFTTSNNFGIWILAIVAVGSLGYIPGFKTVSNGLLILVVIVLVLSNKGFFSQFSSAVTSIGSSTQALNSSPQASPNQTVSVATPSTVISPISPIIFNPVYNPVPAT
jgi:hypothetical protein